jgi:hypothetical protein
MEKTVYPPVIIAIDIEARGMGMFQHGIMSIGVCVGSAIEDRVLEKRRFDMRPLDGQSLEPRCWEEFWCKNQKQYAALTANAKDAMEQIVAFRNFINYWDDSAPSTYLVCDNPAFDFAFINYYLDRAMLPALSYTMDAQYRPLHDSDSYGRGVLKKPASDQWISNTELLQVIGQGASPIDLNSHDHMPENDAEVIYHLHLRALIVNSSWP